MEPRRSHPPLCRNNYGSRFINYALGLICYAFWIIHDEESSTPEATCRLQSVKHKSQTLAAMNLNRPITTPWNPIIDCSKAFPISLILWIRIACCLFPLACRRFSHQRPQVRVVVDLLRRFSVGCESSQGLFCALSVSSFGSASLGFTYHDDD